MGLKSDCEPKLYVLASSTSPSEAWSSSPLPECSELASGFPCPDHTHQCLPQMSQAQGGKVDVMGHHL